MYYTHFYRLHYTQIGVFEVSFATQRTVKLESTNYKYNGAIVKKRGKSIRTSGLSSISLQSALSVSNHPCCACINQPETITERKDNCNLHQFHQLRFIPKNFTNNYIEIESDATLKSRACVETVNNVKII